MTFISFVFITALIAFISWLKTKDEENSAKGYFLAGHERVERLVVQHRHEAGAPAGEVVDEVRAALFFFGGQQVVAVQEVFAEVAGDAAPGQRVTQHFPGASGIRIPGFVGVDKSYLIPPGMRLAPASRQAEQNYPAR